MRCVPACVYLHMCLYACICVCAYMHLQCARFCTCSCMHIWVTVCMCLLIWYVCFALAIETRIVIENNVNLTGMEKYFAGNLEIYVALFVYVV